LCSADLRLQIGADDVNDLALSNFVRSRVQLLENRLKAVQSIVGNASNDEPDPEHAEVILSFQLAVHRYQYVKPILSKAEKWPVFAGAPTGLGYVLYRVTRKSFLQADGNTLV